MHVLVPFVTTYFPSLGLPGAGGAGVGAAVVAGVGVVVASVVDVVCK